MSEQQSEATQAAEPTVTASEGASGAQEATQPQAPGFDTSQLLQRFEELQGTVQNLAGTVQAQQQQDPYAAGPQFDPYTGQALNDPAYGLDFTDPAQVQEYINAQIQQGVQQSVSPIQQDLYRRDIEQVFSDHPEIKSDPQVQQAVVGVLQELGHDPNSAVPPQALRAAFELHRAREFARNQTPAGQQGSEAVVESGQAQVPQEPEDVAAMILRSAPNQGIRVGPAH